METLNLYYIFFSKFPGDQTKEDTTWSRIKMKKSRRGKDGMLRVQAEASVPKRLITSNLVFISTIVKVEWLYTCHVNK